MTTVSRRPARSLFLVEASDEIDTLLRLLNLFAVRQVRVLKLEVAPSAAGLAIRLETDPMDASRAAQLADKLATLPIVRSVGTGWLASARGA
jgi:hypothetical protein